MKLYRIKNWSGIYENNRTRDLKSMSWLPLPIKLNGDGFTLTMEQDNGLQLFGSFIILLELAACCNPRGTLIRSDGTPHDCRSIVRLSRMKMRDCEKCLDFFSTTCKWLEIEEIQDPAGTPHEGAVKPHEPALHNSILHTEHTEHIYKKFAHLKITTEEFGKLQLEGHTKEEIDNILADIENYKKNTNYKSLYLTALKWLRNNKAKIPAQKKPKYFDAEAYQKQLMEEQAKIDEQREPELF